MSRKTITVVVASMCASLVIMGCAQNRKSSVMSIRIAEQAPNHITPGVWDGQVFSLNPSIYDYLVEIDPVTGELVPSLASSWESADGKKRDAQAAFRSPLPWRKLLRF